MSRRRLKKSNSSKFRPSYRMWPQAMFKSDSKSDKKKSKKSKRKKSESGSMKKKKIKSWSSSSSSRQVNHKNKKKTKKTKVNNKKKKSKETSSNLRPAYRPPPVAFSTDLSNASADNFVQRFSIVQEGAQAVVDLDLPGGSDLSEDVYVLHKRSIEIGSTCPSTGGSHIPTREGQTLVSVFLHTDSVVILCIDEVVVGQASYIFEDFSAAGGMDSETDEVSF